LVSSHDFRLAHTYKIQTMPAFQTLEV